MNIKQYTTLLPIQYSDAVKKTLLEISQDGLLQRKYTGYASLERMRYLIEKEEAQLVKVQLSREALSKAIRYLKGRMESITYQRLLNGRTRITDPEQRKYMRMIYRKIKRYDDLERLIKSGQTEFLEKEVEGLSFDEFSCVEVKITKDQIKKWRKELKDAQVDPSRMHQSLDIKWSKNGDDLLNISEDKKYFKLHERIFIFSKNSKHSQALVEALLVKEKIRLQDIIKKELML